MLTKIAKNRLLLAVALAISAYWAAGLLLPSVVFSTFVAVFLLVFGGITFLRYSPTAFDILFRGARSDESEGSHLAALGVTALALGSVYVGLWSLAWNYFGQPLDWISTPSSLFGRGLMGFGFFLLFFSPDISRKGMRLPDGFLIFCVAVIALVVAFFLGTRFDTNNTVVVTPLAYTAVSREVTFSNDPICPDAKPVWGNTNGGRRIYHLPTSHHREGMSPDKCFATPEEAEKAGFRASKT